MKTDSDNNNNNKNEKGNQNLSNTHYNNCQQNQRDLLLGVLLYGLYSIYVCVCFSVFVYVCVAIDNQIWH